MSERAAATKEGKRSSFLKTIRGYFLKASLNLSIATSKLRSIAEDVLSSDEVVNELFLVTSSSSVDPSLLENRDTPTHQPHNNNMDTPVISDQPQEDMSNSTSKGNNSINNNNNSIPSFTDFDSVAEADLLREDGVPFVDGGVVWQKRRSAWLSASQEEKLSARQKASESVLSVVPKDSYAVVYHNLVDKQKTLKKPLNLRDAIKVINAGWTNSGKWERAAHGMA